MSKYKNIWVIGNLGNKGNMNNGQTIKTKTMLRVLNNHFGENHIIVTDTNMYANKKIAILKSLLINLIKSDVIILNVCDLAIFLLAIPTWLIAKFKRKKICYVLVGGWLDEFVDEHKLIGKVLKKYDLIFAETKYTGLNLEKKGFKNISYIKNCKYIECVKDKKENGDVGLKFCMLSRVVPEKGIEDAIDAINSVNRNTSVSYDLDIFGEISKEYYSDIITKINTNKEHVHYGGIIDFDKCAEVISKYDALIFPTRIMTEGIPGTIIDAMFAGTPVIATEWNSCKELITYGYNGLYYQGNGEKLAQILQQPDLKRRLQEMQNNCIREAEKYKPDVAFEPLIKFLKL